MHRRELFECLSGSQQAQDTEMEGSAQFQSDGYVRRQTATSTLFNNSNSPTDVNYRQDIHRAISRNYILNLFTQEMDRRLTHLFLRQSSVFIVLVSLEDVIADPVIQLENLLYWLRLVQTYVEPSGVPRVVIVGMCDGPMDGQVEQQCLSHLEGAIRDQEFQHVFSKNNVSLIHFNRSAPMDCVPHLCLAIDKCVDAMVQRVWHFNRPSFDLMFSPFTGLTEILIKIDRWPQIVASADDLHSMYKFYDEHYFSTLAAYSSALISHNRRTYAQYIS